MKRKQKNLIIIVVCACVAILSGVLFGMYKILVTPKVIVGLALNNAEEDITKSIEFFTDSDEKEVISSVLRAGGKTEMNATITESSFLKGVSAEITSNSDGNCTVSEIEFNDLLKLEAYKDSERILINTPLFNGGFEIKLDGMEDAIESSIFKDKVIASPEAISAPVVVNLISGRFDIEDFYDKNAAELKSIAKGIEVKKSGTSAVMVGGSSKKAKAYSAYIKEEDMDRIITMIKDYGKELGIEAEDIEAGLKNIRTDCDVIFKIKDFTLREICIKTSENNEKTIAFTGEENPFDTITYYENGDAHNALRRRHTMRGTTITEDISKGDKTLLWIEKNYDETEIRIGSGDMPFVISASGKTVDDDYVSYKKLEFGLEDTFMISSDIRISEEYDKDFSFNKSGEYINLFSLTDDEWAATSGVLMQGIKLFGE